VNRRAFLECAVGTLGTASLANRAFGVGWNASGAAEARTLREAAQKRGLLVGSAISTGQIAQQDVAQLIAQQCSIVVAENDMKWRWTQPEENRFDFERADEIMAFAEKNGLSVRGHNLCWYESLPEWFEKTATKENAARLLRKHIMVVAGRYAGRIQSWDVVNEAIEVKDGRPDGLRDSIWMRLLGPEYLAIAFRTAAETDPKARLTYNDFGLEGDTRYHAERRKVALRLLRWFRENNIPIHVLGLQSHLHPSSSGNFSGLNEFIDQVGKLGLEVYVTELDVNAGESEGAGVYKNYLQNVVRHPAVKAVLTWGLTSRGRQHQERLLPFDASLEPTRAFTAMREALLKA
jgi:endo-1,4-beta-xylanase